MGKIFETKPSFHVKQGTTGQSSISYFHEILLIEKNLILGERLSTRL